MSVLPTPRLDAETYLAIDRKAEWKSELHDGEMIPIEPVSVNHAAIDINVSALLKSRRAATGCRAFGAQLRVRVASARFVSSDFQIVCGKVEKADEIGDTLVNPKVILEILSPSTENYDHGAKFEFYQQIPMLADYVMISQSKARVEAFSKQSDEEWKLRIAEGTAKVARLESIGVELPLAEIYEGIDFESVSIE